MPSMPVALLERPGRLERYRAAYFDIYPGVWRHGDWIVFTERGSSVITGRSDATLNRGGVRLGTSEFYSVLEDLDEVLDSLVVHLDDERRAAPLRRAPRRASSSTTRCAGDRGRAPRRALAAPRPGHDRRTAGDPEDADRQEARAAGQADPHRRAGRRRSSARTRSPTRRRSSRWRHTPVRRAGFSRSRLLRRSLALHRCRLERLAAKDQVGALLGGAGWANSDSDGEHRWQPECVRVDTEVLNQFCGTCAAERCTRRSQIGTSSAPPTVGSWMQPRCSFQRAARRRPAPFSAWSQVGDLVAVLTDVTPFHPLDHTWPDQPADRGTIAGQPVA